MGNRRRFIKPNHRQVRDMHIRGRLYAGNTKPCQVLVPTRCVRPPREIGPRFPYSESILDGAQIQPFVHDIIIDVKEGGQTYSFRVSYKKHRRLPECPFLHFRGSMFVMRVAAFEPDSVVNMRDRDTILSDFMIKEFVSKIKSVGTRRLPDRLTFQKYLHTRDSVY